MQTMETSVKMDPVMMIDYAWVKKFDPKKRVLTGAAYHAVKRFMALALALASLPFWLP